MPEGEVGKLNIKLRAKLDELQKDLKKAEAMAKKSGKVAEQSGKVSLGGMAGAAMKATAAFGGLELAVKGIDAISEAVSGNFEGAAEMIKTLPAGIGPFATALEGVLGKVTGISAAIAGIREETERIASQAADQLRERTATGAVFNAAQKRAEELRFETSIRGLKKVEQERRRIQRARDQELASIDNAIRRNEGKFGGGEAVAALKAQRDAVTADAAGRLGAMDTGSSAAKKLKGAAGTAASAQSLGQGRQLGAFTAVTGLKAQQTPEVSILNKIDSKLGTLVSSQIGGIPAGAT